MLPVISDGVYGYQHVNVAEQRRDSDSLLNWMERMIRMRKEVPEIGWGDFVVLKTAPDILALRYDWRNNSVVLLHNFSAVPREVRLEVGLEGTDNQRLINLLSAEHSTVDDSGKHCILIEAYGYRWFRAGGLAYLLNRTDI